MDVKESALQLKSNKWVKGAVIGSLAASSAFLLKSDSRNKVMKFFRRDKGNQEHEATEEKAD
jgi:gas vesicle protein